MIRNADGDQLASIAARNPGGRGKGAGAPALFQALAGARYRAGASYVLTLGVGVSSVQPPTGDAAGRPPSLRFALTFTDDAGRRREVVGRSVTPADVLADNRAAVSPPDRLVHFTVATTLPRSPVPACAGRGIGVLITTASNASAHAGHFILDHVTLVADVPRAKAGRAGKGGKAKATTVRR
jgi:hypothetical protein